MIFYVISYVGLYRVNDIALVTALFDNYPDLVYNKKRNIYNI